MFLSEASWSLHRHNASGSAFHAMVVWLSVRHHYIIYNRCMYCYQMKWNGIDTISISNWSTICYQERINFGFQSIRLMYSKISLMIGHRMYLHNSHGKQLQDAFQTVPDEVLSQLLGWLIYEASLFQTAYIFLCMLTIAWNCVSSKKIIFVMTQ